jgi:hypothetical protein
VFLGQSAKARDWLGTGMLIFMFMLVFIFIRVFMFMRVCIYIVGSHYAIVCKYRLAEYSYTENIHLCFGNSVYKPSYIIVNLFAFQLLHAVAAT